ERQMLTCDEAKRIHERFRDRERDRDRVARLALDLCDLQAVELAHASVGLEIVERLEAVEATVMRLARRRAELRNELRAFRRAARARDLTCGAAQRTDAGDIDRPNARSDAPAAWWCD